MSAHADDIEREHGGDPGARGIVLPSRHHPAVETTGRGRHSDQWLKARGLPRPCRIDTRALTRRTGQGQANAVSSATSPRAGRSDALKREALELAGPRRHRLVPMGPRTGLELGERSGSGTRLGAGEPTLHVVRIETESSATSASARRGKGCRVTVVPANDRERGHHRIQPDGVFLSNGTGRSGGDRRYAVPVIPRYNRRWHSDLGIGLGHQSGICRVGARR